MDAPSRPAFTCVAGEHEPKKRKNRRGRGARGRINKTIEKTKRREEIEKEIAAAAAMFAVRCVIYFVLNPKLLLGDDTLKELIYKGKKTCAGRHVEILRAEQVENLVSILGALDVRIAGCPRARSTQGVRSAALASWVQEQGYVQLETTVAVWLLFATQRDGSGTNQLVGQFTIEALATVEWAKDACDRTNDDVSWVEEAVDKLDGPGARAASRIAVVGALRRVSNDSPVSLARTCAHRDGGPHHMPLASFQQQLRDQGGVLFW